MRTAKQPAANIRAPLWRFRFCRFYSTWHNLNLLRGKQQKALLARTAKAARRSFPRRARFNSPSPLQKVRSAKNSPPPAFTHHSGASGFAASIPSVKAHAALCGKRQKSAARPNSASSASFFPAQGAVQLPHPLQKVRSAQNSPYSRPFRAFPASSPLFCAAQPEQRKQRVVFCRAIGGEQIPRVGVIVPAVHAVDAAVVRRKVERDASAVGQCERE